MFKIKKEDTVVVVVGKDKGKKGKVLKIFPQNNRVIVEGINMIKKHVRRRREQEQSGIIEMESTVHISNLMVLCRHCNKPARIGMTFLKDKSKSRICKKCGESL